MKYVIIRNNKAPIKCVFDYLELPELENPKPHQKKMLSEICDGIDIIEIDHFNYKIILKTRTCPGDYLYKAGHNGRLQLVGINKHK